MERETMFTLINRGQWPPEVPAIELAKQIAAFPQLCMNSDRLSAYRQWDFDIEGALGHEAHAGVAPLREGAAVGAKRFTDGVGRGGSFAAFKGD